MFVVDCEPLAFKRLKERGDWWKDKFFDNEKVVLNVIKENRTVYGINTGFGLLANTRINVDELELLQRSIVLSHAAGTGDFMQEDTVRLLMLLKINSLARGYSGIRLSVIEALITLFNAQVYPAIPEKGSVGASGDLAPLAHMSVVLLGEGEAFYKGERISAAQALEIAGMQPIALAPKEGLALVNGTEYQTAIAVKALNLSLTNLHYLLITMGLHFVALKGYKNVFDMFAKNDGGTTMDEFRNWATWGILEAVAREFYDSGQ